MCCCDDDGGGGILGVLGIFGVRVDVWVDVVGFVEIGLWGVLVGRIEFGVVFWSLGFGVELGFCGCVFGGEF